MRLKDIHVTLFFTKGISLRTWDEIGMFDREIALYRRLQARGVKVSFVTYGDASDLDYADRIPGIDILVNRWRLKLRHYCCLLPVLHGPFLARASVYKTNQMDGIDIALNAARLWRKPLVARCGYMRSEFIANQYGKGSTKAHNARKQEEVIFNAANRIVVTTSTMQKDVMRRVPSAANRAVVIPNYVDTNRFRPMRENPDEDEIIFVGRLSTQKNVAALLEAVQSLNVKTTLIGDGELKVPLKHRFGTLNGRLLWQGNVPNSELPVHLNRASLFILPSHYEGHPKALMEAMACGLPVIGADSPGIRGVIRHGETGWLCHTDPKSIRKAIQQLLALPKMRAELGRQARHFIKEQFSLDRVVDMELALLREVTVL